MVIARVVDGAMQIIGRLKQRVHLADGLDENSVLSEEAVSYTHLDVYKRQVLQCFAVAADNLLIPGERLLPAAVQRSVAFVIFIDVDLSLIHISS